MRFAIAWMLLGVMACTSSCGTVVLNGNLNNQTTVTGTVSVVQVIVTDGGVQLTLVTLLQTAGPQDFRFCGNLAPQFPMNSNVSVQFTPGTTCGSRVAVTIIG